MDCSSSILNYPYILNYPLESAQIHVLWVGDAI